jgi:hypothetical protein
MCNNVAVAQKKAQLHGIGKRLVRHSEMIAHAEAGEPLGGTSIGSM